MDQCPQRINSSLDLVLGKTSPMDDLQKKVSASECIFFVLQKSQIHLLFAVALSFFMEVWFRVLRKFGISWVIDAAQ